MSYAEQYLELESSMASSVPSVHNLGSGDARAGTENLVSTVYMTVTVDKCAI